MPSPAAGAFWIVAALALVGVPLYAGWRRGRTYGIVAVVSLALALPGALLTHGHLARRLGPELALGLDVAFCWGVVAMALHLASLVNARLRSRPFRALVSIPGLTFAAAGALAGPWLLALLPVRASVAAAGGGPGVDWLAAVPLLLVAVSLVTTVRPVAETVRFTLGGGAEDEDAAPTVRRLPLERHRRRPPPPAARRPLRLVQIADPHLGPWQSVAALRRRVEHLLAHQPDLVVLTGDFLTMEGQGTPGALAEALAPLRRMPGRCIAVLGNHDHEAPDEVRAALAACGAILLVDDETTVDTPVGPAQIVGADWVGRGCRDHLLALLARHPRRPGHLRLLLLHDPRGFRFVPPGAVDLTLSGHTHGGQVGLVSIGLDWTVLSRSRWPDHGLFGHGSNRLYVHRGTGFYGFPLRIGVPGELSVLEVVPGAAGVADPRAAVYRM